MDLTGTTVVMSFKHINVKEVPHDECHEMPAVIHFVSILIHQSSLLNMC